MGPYLPSMYLYIYTSVNGFIHRQLAEKSNALLSYTPNGTQAKMKQVSTYMKNNEIWFKLPFYRVVCTLLLFLYRKVSYLEMFSPNSAKKISNYYLQG